MAWTKQKKRLISHHFEQRMLKISRMWRNDEADWRDVAALILEWETAQPDGMNDFLKVLAQLLGLQISNLWRFRKAVLSARDIWKDSGHPVKEAFDIPEHVGPESIELVEKISRAAPSEIINDVSQRLYENKITRSELRKIWQNIRHVVKDESRRIPLYGELPRMDEKRRSKLFEEICFEALRKDLIDSKVPVLGGSGMCFRDDIINRMLVDLVAVTEDEDGRAVYHGIEVKTALKANHLFDTFQNIYQHFDYLWIVVPDEIDDFRSVPEMAGVLQYINGKIKVIRKARRNPKPDLQLVSRRIIPKLLKK